jgi:UvrD/REP helicase N-terminal domain/UvrD-like helicase C-terminal domain
VYLKQFALSDPQLTGWDVILYDEAQDADPCIAGIVEAQSHAQLIAVGDSAQAIYGWRGAGDFLAKLGAAHRLVLTQSWRFGPAVAEEGNAWLEVLGTGMRITGNPARTSRLDDNPDAILCRSNAGTVEQLLKAHEAGTKVYLEGGGGEIKQLAEAAERLQNGQRAFHPELVAFKDWSEVIDYAESDPGGSDLAVGVKLIEQYGAGEVIRAIDGTVRTGSQDELVVSTAHKSKGLEWDRVRIATDFKEPLDKKTGEPLPIPPADAMLAYVAVTRAKDTLDDAGLAWVHGHMDRMRPRPGTDATAATPTASPASAPPVAAVPSGTTGQDFSAEVATARDEGAEATDPIGETSRYLARFGLAEGISVLVAGERGRFHIRGIGPDGSLTCYGATGARSFPPEWCTPATRNGRGGKQVQVRSVPESAKAARAAWRAGAQHRGRLRRRRSGHCQGVDALILRQRPNLSLAVEAPFAGPDPGERGDSANGCQVRMDG